MIIRSLRTNHLENPMGFMMDKPYFTWTAESATGKKQAAARIEVSLTDSFETPSIPACAGTFPRSGLSRSSRCSRAPAITGA